MICLYYLKRSTWREWVTFIARQFIENIKMTSPVDLCRLRPWEQVGPCELVRSPTSACFYNGCELHKHLHMCVQ